MVINFKSYSKLPRQIIRNTMTLYIFTQNKKVILSSQN